MYFSCVDIIPRSIFDIHGFIESALTRRFTHSWLVAEYQDMSIYGKVVLIKTCHSCVCGSHISVDVRRQLIFVRQPFYF
jgi:hypothetical protein